MKCPLRVVAIPSQEVMGISIVYDCLQEECALYHDGLKDCGLFLIQEYLALILAQLVEKNK